MKRLWSRPCSSAFAPAALHSSSFHFQPRQSFATGNAAKAARGLGVGKLNHVAIAVPDLQQASTLYRDIMGAEVSEPAPLQEHGVTTVFVNLGNTKIELLHPLGEKSPIAGFLQKRPGGGIHHICLEVDDIHKALAILKEKGIKAIDPNPKIGAHGKPVVFLHPKDMNGVLLELEQV